MPNIVWLEMGGIYAQANLRGGGEYGEEWHQAGTRLKKQNVFDDFIAAAEWLICEQVHVHAEAGDSGGSNGGLLIGACVTQRPDLFGAALAGSGRDGYAAVSQVHDWMGVDVGLRIVGQSRRSSRRCTRIRRCTILKPGTKYPPTLIATADHDDRVVPGHSFKFAATMQADQAGTAPVLIRVETKAGHGAGKPISKVRLRRWRTSGRL